MRESDKEKKRPDVKRMEPRVIHESKDPSTLGSKKSSGKADKKW